MRTSTRRTTITGERPLNPAERTVLVIAAAATTLIFYAITTIVSVVLLAVCTLLVAVLIGAARIGLAGLVSDMLQRKWQLLKIVLRSLWLREGAEYRLKITNAEAPRLFALVTKLATKMGVRPPSTVFVEMNHGAWVRLHGLLRGRGKSTLGIGYDLLAGLPEHEVEAVLAHEMAHARLVNRGLKKWMNKGVGRLTTMSQALSVYTTALRRAEKRTYTGELLYRICDALTTRTVRLVATYSRQDEFEADAGAAEAVGGASIRWALIHLERLSNDLERFPWEERIARLETEKSFSRWLVGALAQESVKPRDQMRDAVDHYSTHPSMRDRIKAIGAQDSVAIPGRPGIELLAEPDRIATQLAIEINRTATAEERKDDRRLQETIRKIQKATQSNWYVLLGAVFLLATIVMFAALLPTMTAQQFLGVGVFGFISFRLIRAGIRKTRRSLPVPKYGTLTWKPPSEDIAALAQKIENDLRLRYGSAGTKPDLEGYLDACMRALGESDYLTAHVAARRALEIAPKNVDAALSLGIAAAALGNREHAEKLHEWVRAVAGWTQPNVKWGVAWARTLMEDHATCEALVTQLIAKQPDQPTFQSLIGYSKMARGKLRTAEWHFRKAMSLEPSNRAHAQLLAALFIESGRTRDAAASMSRFRAEAEQDSELAQLFCRLELLRRNVDEAMRWAGIVQALDPNPAWHIQFGFMFETARLDEQAAEFFRRALEVGHFPEAHIGLARIRTARGERDSARTHLLDALNAERERAPQAQSPLRLFNDIVMFLNQLEDRRVQCRAWVATVPKDEKAGALSEQSLFVCAPDRGAAVTSLQRVVSALYPSSALAADKFVWKEAPPDQQPVRPIAPGVQHVV